MGLQKAGVVHCVLFSSRMPPTPARANNGDSGGPQRHHRHQPCPTSSNVGISTQASNNNESSLTKLCLSMYLQPFSRSLVFPKQRNELKKKMKKNGEWENWECLLVVWNFDGDVRSNIFFSSNNGITYHYKSSYNNTCILIYFVYSIIEQIWFKNFISIGFIWNS